MRKNLIVLILICLNIITLAQNVHVGILYNYFPKILDENSDNATHTFNLIGIDLREKDHIINNFSTGLILQYGKKDLLNIKSGEFNQLNDYDAFRAIQLLSLELSIMYDFKKGNYYVLAFGLKIGVERLYFEDKIHIYGTHFNGYFDFKNSFSKFNHKISYSPVIEFNYLLLKNCEILFGVEYKTLDFSIKHENNSIINSSEEISHKVEEEDYYYNISFTGMSLSLGIKYIL